MRRAELQDDEHARVPFSLIAVLLLIGTLFAGVAYREMAKESTDSFQAELEFELVEELTESTQFVLQMQARAMAMRAIVDADDGVSEADNAAIAADFSASFTELIEMEYNESTPLLLSGYEISVESGSLIIELVSNPEATQINTWEHSPDQTESDGVTSTDHYSSASEDSLNETLASGSNDEDLIWRASNTSVFYRLNGAADLNIVSKSTGTKYARTVLIQSEVEVPNLLVDSRSRRLTNSLTDPEDGLARIVRDILTTLAQQRALTGWAAWAEDEGDVNTSQTVENLFSPAEVELAVNLGLILLVAKEWRILDLDAIASLEADLRGDIDHSSTPLSTLVSQFAESGNVKPALLVAVWEGLLPAVGGGSGDTEMGIGAILERIINTVIDYYVVVVVDEFNIIFSDLSEIIEEDGSQSWLESVWDALTGDQSRPIGVEAFQHFTVSTIEMADEEGLMDSDDILRQPFFGDPTLILLAEGSPDNTETTKTIPFSYQDYSVGNTWWAPDGTCGTNGESTFWREYQHTAQLSGTASVDVQFLTQDAFDPAKDMVWETYAEDFVNAVKADTEDSLKEQITQTISGFATTISTELAGGTGPLVPDVDDWSDVVDWISGEHPELQLIRHIEEMINRLMEYLEDQVDALRDNLVKPIHGFISAIYNHIIDFFTDNVYYQLADWSNQQTTMRNAAQGALFSRTTFDSDPTGFTDCGSRGNSNSEPSDSQLRTELSDGSHDSALWTPRLYNPIETEYDELRTFDVGQLQLVAGLWQPSSLEEIHETVIGGQVDDLVFGTVGSDETNFISLIWDAAKNLTTAMKMTSEFSNLPQDLAMSPGTPFQLWRGDYAEALAGDGVRNLSFRLQNGTSLRLPTAQIHSTANFLDADAEAARGAEQDSLHIIVGESTGYHFSNASSGDVVQTFEATLQVSVIGHKDIFIQSVDGYLERANSLDPVSRTLSIDIDIDLQISVQTAWPLYRVDSNNDIVYFDGHDPLNTDDHGEATDDLKAQVKKAYKLVKDALDFIAEFVDDPLGVLTDLVSEILKKLMTALKEALIKFITDTISDLVDRAWQFWLDNSDFEFKLFGLRFNLCFPLNQQGDHEDWCKTAVPDGTGDSPGSGHPVMVMGSVSWSAGLFSKQVSDSQPEDSMYGRDEFTRFTIYLTPHKEVSEGDDEVPVGGDHIWDAGIKKCRNQSDGKFVASKNCMGNDEGSYTIIVQIERVRIKSRINIIIDPLQTSSDHWLMLDYIKHPSGNKDGLRIHLEAPFETDYKIARISTADIPVVGDRLKSIPVGPTGLAIGFEAGFEIRYRTDIGSGTGALMLDAVDLNAGGASSWMRLYNPNEAGNPVNPGEDADYYVCVVGAIDACEDLSTMDAIPGEGTAEYQLPVDWSLATLAGDPQVRLVLYRDSQPVDDTGWFDDQSAVSGHHRHKQTTGGTSWTDSSGGPTGDPPPAIRGPSAEIQMMIEDGDFGLAVLQLLRESIDTTYQEMADDLTLDLEGATEFVKRMVDRFLRELLEMMRRGIVEVTLFIEGFVTTVAGGPQAGLRLAFSIDGQALVTVLQWLMGYIGYYMQHIGDDTAQPPPFPERVVAGLWVSADLFVGTESSRVGVQFKANIPLFQSAESRVFEWRILFGVYEFSKDADGKWTEEWWFHGTVEPITN